MDSENAGRATDATEVTTATEGEREGVSEQGEDGAREMIMLEKMLPPPPPPPSSSHSKRASCRAGLAPPCMPSSAHWLT